MKYGAALLLASVAVASAFTTSFTAPRRSLLAASSTALSGRKARRETAYSNMDDVIDWFDSGSDLEDVKNSMNLMSKAYEGGKENEFEEWKSASAVGSSSSPNTWSYDTNEGGGGRGGAKGRNNNRQGNRQGGANPNSGNANSVDVMKILQEFDYAQVKSRPSAKSPPQAQTFDADDLFGEDDSGAGNGGAVVDEGEDIEVREAIVGTRVIQSPSPLYHSNSSLRSSARSSPRSRPPTLPPSHPICYRRSTRHRSRRFARKFPAPSRATPPPSSPPSTNRP